MACSTQDRDDLHLRRPSHRHRTDVHRGDCTIAKRHDVPVFVDAAAEILTIPNVHLQRGATLVGYSGGKYIRGPQSAGLLLGRKDLVRAAWVHSAPHHGYARAMKVGREEIVGMVVAVESWVKRDHAAEWNTGIGVVTAMLAECDEKIVAQRIAGLLRESRPRQAAEPIAAPGADLSGRWEVAITYSASKTTHTLQLQQRGNRLKGLHQGDFLSRDISGTINGDAVSLASIVTERHGDALTYRFRGTVSGDTIAGSLDMGEYLGATWSARRPAGTRTAATP
jgi:seryl-tRNA(Sec) selenium transferase